jgi:hypothetical protein
MLAGLAGMTFLLAAPAAFTAGFSGDYRRQAKR